MILVYDYSFTFLYLNHHFLSSQKQTKRKLDDANKRLESLYDKLREQTVSSLINILYYINKYLIKHLYLASEYHYSSSGACRVAAIIFLLLSLHF